MSQSVQRSLAARSQRIVTDFANSDTEVEQRLNAMREHTAAELTTQSKAQLGERYQQIAANVKKRVTYQT